MNDNSEHASAGPGASPSSTASIDVTAPIVRVTVYEDRADVAREADVTLPAGAALVVVKELPVLLSDEHVVAHLHPVDGAGVAHLNDTRVERLIVDDGAPSDDQDRRRTALHDEIEKLDDDIALADIALKRVSAERARAEIALRRYGDLLARAVGRGGGSVESWRASLDVLDDKITACDAERAEKRAALDALKKKRVRAADDARPRPLGQRTVAEVRLRVSSPTGGRYRLSLSNVTACAAWRPAHEAHLSFEGAAADGHGGEVRFVTCAAVWNRTGEAWTDVALALSTARPSAGAELPALRADRLTLRQKTAEERRTIVVEHREEGVPKSATQGTAPGVDDGGEARTFRADKSTIPDDGRPHRVQVASFTAPCSVERIAYPELAPQVFLRASLKNAGAGPILAGGVALSQQGTFVGTGDVTYVGVGESFDLSFGSDDRFTVRTKKRRAEDKKLVGKDVVHFIREAVLSHTGDGTERVMVHLRMPVSEVKQLKVLPSPQHSSVDLGEHKPDEHGIVRVPVELAPNVEKKLALAFSFDTSGDVRIPDPW